MCIRDSCYIYQFEFPSVRSTIGFSNSKILLLEGILCRQVWRSVMRIKGASTRVGALALVWSVAMASLVAQTALKLPKNRFTPEQDVKLGQEAAAEVRQQYPIIED